MLSAKQRAYLREAHARWNFKGGATRSGKTWLDVNLVIPLRIRAVAGKPGLVVLLGMSRQTVERNLLCPMRERYGALVGTLSAEGTVRLFGEECWVIGAEKVTGTSRLRGASVKYAYGDEVADWHPEVFRLLASRLDRAYSRFDGTYNPRGPTHWLCRFLRETPGIYHQQYGLTDNPFLPAAFVASLKAEYRDTVTYERYILGRWASAEGSLFPCAPPETEKARVHGGIAHVDAAYGGGDCTALTLARRDGETIVLYGRLWKGHVDEAMAEIARLCRKHACAPLYCEKNADRGYLAREFARMGLLTRPYTERENKFVKISTYLRKHWPSIALAEGTDEAYLAQILDYTDQAAHDDAPDSAACCCRLLDRRAEDYRSPFEGGVLLG